MVQQEIRKGPWTEQEDIKLVSFVGLFGDRRWDFISKVSGLNRSGKSCRLRWVNYLHPGLKRGKMTPQEERLVLDLHSKWGNRWSKIARRLPGRTDNEIKNYWRTHMRKKAQDQKKRAAAATISSPNSSSNSHNSSSLSPNNNHAVDPFSSKKAGEESFYDTGGPNMIASSTEINVVGEDQLEGYILDDIWKDIDIALPEEVNNLHILEPVTYDGHSGVFCPPITTSPSWQYSEPLWVMDEEESNMLFPIISDPYFS